MTGTILERIIEAKRERISAAKQLIPQNELRAVAEARGNGPQRFRFREAVSDPKRVNVIAEFKRASPSLGSISNRLLPEEVAKVYENGGAAAISVLTEEDYFLGSLDDFRAVKRTVAIPILRKDFIVDEYQIYESAAAGADAILLIVAALDQEQLKLFLGSAIDVGLDVLVEIHDQKELEIALEIGAYLIGVNNRDLKTFKVSLEVSESLVKQIPSGKVTVAESGIGRHEEIVRLRVAGFSAFLVGETLMRSPDLSADLQKLIGVNVLSNDRTGNSKIR